jgi:hypothetical protein
MELVSVLEITWIFEAENKEGRRMRRFLLKGENNCGQQANSRML